tara:strand:+ start:1118 stop:1735 length:618 start_codon:yes stop_codon:yes gene_type:complete
MDKQEIKQHLIEKFNISDRNMVKIVNYVDLLLKFNKKYNLIGKSTENDIWCRHILDCAQVVKFLDFKSNSILSDFGSGAGLPGVIIAIFKNNPRFHVKLYEKSPVKRSFLREIQSFVDFTVEENVYDFDIIKTDYIVCRAFKKLEEIFRISREKVKNPHKIIILKGKKASEELKKLPNNLNYRYRIENSLTDKDSKIIIADKYEK